MNSRNMEKIFNPEVNKNTKLSLMLLLLIVFILLQVTPAPPIIVLSFTVLLFAGSSVFHIFKVAFYQGSKKGKDTFIIVISLLMLGFALTLY
ncbi:hypothetical protein D7Z54_12045 [Salibacterium salarium]|uniref:Uncharacterized protein n=1 Tax=Salibacterium salarium TaxID=284579 RepID=A0A3R9RDI6_9BACI|nr:hypothetical protein [Salibacterium salarium]RSL33037.1 hypothetical protein D7Z54_12045 [Salibacterium salarium]